MASIFTYELEPVKLASPWPSRYEEIERDRTLPSAVLCDMPIPPIESIDSYELEKLSAEPQDGPVEYKLHLLLRPRRDYTKMSTGRKVSGSHLSKARPSTSLTNRGPRTGTASSSLTPNSHTRQNRLQHLTTQLLWRLQQSLPQHSASKGDLTQPILPELDVASSQLKSPGPPVAGLEESKGALYEIGISDDGTLVGLTFEELEESLQVLCIMAHSLGCRSQIRRMIGVGHCEWIARDDAMESKAGIREEDLFVCEVLISPHLVSNARSLVDTSPHSPNVRRPAGEPKLPRGKPQARDNAQLRISLTGSTTSGKSSLLGTLSTSTLDNGRGKSRLSLLRHRHEIVSGVTSSLAQELIGYQAPTATSSESIAAHINHYSSGNITSWADIHAMSDGGRLVFLTDSAGHPKFRRTTARGLISWDPHWAICCIAANEHEDSHEANGAVKAQEDMVMSQHDSISLSQAHLKLCLKLNLPLICVLTKLDLASKNGLRQTLGRILSTVKLAHRTPVVLPASFSNGNAAFARTVPYKDVATVRNMWEKSGFQKASDFVPIVLTSSVTGSGISQLHSLLSQLPTSGLRQQPPVSAPSFPRNLFHIDEIFALNSPKGHKTKPVEEHQGPRFILSGNLRRGSIHVGDKFLLGPFSYDSVHGGIDHVQTHRSGSVPSLSQSLPQDLASFSKHQSRPPDTVRTNLTDQGQSGGMRSRPTWYPVVIGSLRYLRLPVCQLSEGQVGTVAISTDEALYVNAEPCLRRGMIICEAPSAPDSTPPAYRYITAVFADPNIYVNPGSSVTLYIASIRAPAKIIKVKVPENAEPDDLSGSGIFSSEDLSDTSDTANANGSAGGLNPGLTEIEILFRFSNTVEWVELGTQVFVTPASGISMLNASSGDAASNTVSGLDGFVGKIVSASS